MALSWTASSTPNVTYSVFRGTTPGGQASTPVASGLTASSYSDAGLSANTAYFYTVKAVRNNVSSAASGEATARTAPAVPTNLSVVSGNSQVALSWTASPGATGYIVSRGTQSGGPYSPIATPTGTSLTDTSAANGMTYFYIN